MPQRSAPVTPDPLVAAVHGRRLPLVAGDRATDDLLDEEERARAASALAACEAIGRDVDRQTARILALLRGVGLAVEAVDPPGPRQDRSIRLRVADRAGAERAVTALEREGFERWEQWRRGARESSRRTADSTTVARTDDVTTVVRLRWARPRGRTRVGRLLRPTASDWGVVDLPERLWWAYSLLRPVRLAAERAGLPVPEGSDLGPFLATPDSLIDPLLDLAGVRADDVVADVGCGDGRLVVRAAARFGCRAVGIEQSAALVERARARARTARVADLVRVDRADARGWTPGDATVVFMFLPVIAVARLLPDALRRLPTGGVVVVHELDPLPGTIRPAPTDSRVLAGADAVTVAHRWTVGPRQEDRPTHPGTAPDGADGLLGG